MQSTKKEDKEICPTCSSSNTRSIVYGLVTGQNSRDKSKYHFAGCMVQPFRYICYDCDVMWGNNEIGDKVDNRKRKFFNSSFNELFDSFNENLDNKKILKEIKEELLYRKKNKKNSDLIYFIDGLLGNHIQKKDNNVLTKLKKENQISKPLVTNRIYKKKYKPNYNEKSILNIYGYKTGKSSTLTKKERIDILIWVHELNFPNKIKELFEEEINSWGEPSSQKRLKKIINHLKHLIINRGKQKTSDYTFAIEDWKMDISELKKIY